MSVIAVQRRHRYGHTVDLVVWECPSCGIVYGVPEDFVDACKRNGTRYYCPNGHSLGWKEDEADRQRKRAVAAERRANSAEETARRYRESRDAARRTAAALRGHLTRMRNRIANGVCPVPGCKRAGFTNVRSHIAIKHPEWHAEHPDL